MSGTAKNTKQATVYPSVGLVSKPILQCSKQERYRHQFIAYIEQQLSDVDATNQEQLKSTFRKLYQEIYSSADKSNQLIISDKERILTSIELAIMGNSNLHLEVWQQVQKLPMVKMMFNSDKYIQLGKELAYIITTLQNHQIELLQGEWWRIKGKNYKVIGSVSMVNYILLEEGKLDFQQALFLSELLPLEINDFYFIGKIQ